MPSYDYRCTTCKTTVELTHGVHDASIKTCPSCGGTLKKLFSATPTHFKGKGFYKTDNRS